MYFNFTIKHFDVKYNIASLISAFILIFLSVILSKYIYILSILVVYVSKKYFPKNYWRYYFHSFIKLFSRNLIKPNNPKFKEYLIKLETLKKEGNDFFKKGKYNDAYEKYTAAISLNVDTKINSLLYSNRAAANLKLENNALALQDANEAIEWDKDNIKGYYRRASANLALLRFNDALNEFEQIKHKFPNDKNLIDNIEKAKKELANKSEHKRNLFSFSKDNTNDNNNNNKINFKFLNDKISKEIITHDYRGPIVPSSFNEKWIVNEIIEKMKANIYIHKKYLLELIKTVCEMYKDEPSLIYINVNEDEKLTIIGDLHGQFYDFLNIFAINGYPSETNPYLFIGDFVDRGSFSVDVVITLLFFKVLYPNHIYIARGNHENRNLNKVYGFENEVKYKYDSDVYEAFIELFHSLPLAHVINNKILTLHGGLFSQDGIKLDDIKKIERFREIPDEGIMCELLWSDPSPVLGRSPNSRGIGINFGQDVTEKFLKDNNLEFLIRAHQVKQEGFEVDGKVITVFSAPNYCDQMGNKGAIIVLKGNELKPKFIQFDAVTHPKAPSFIEPWMFF